jgi:hypothetical protein
VIAGLQEIDTGHTNTVNETMLPSDATGPGTGVSVFQWFWFPNPDEGIVEYGIHQVEDAKSNATIRLHPKT